MITILVARLANEQLFYLTTIQNRNELKAMREHTAFFCPGCSMPVQLKIGEVTIPHFAHLRKSSCDSYSEPESALHLHGKLLLHQWFQSLSQPSELEKHYPAIRQRADVVVDNQAVIEFQCSAIPLPSLLERTAGYRSAGLETHWIQGVPEALPEGIRLMRLKAHETGFFESANGTLFYRAFSPDKRCFYYVSHLMPVSSMRWIAKVRALPLSRQQFPFLIPAPLKKKEFFTMLKLYKQARQTFIHSQRYVRRKYQHPFWLCTYKLRLDIDRLPEIIGVPLPNGHLIPCNSVLWQLQAVHALSKGQPLVSLVENGRIPVAERTAADEVEQLLENYAALYKRWEAGEIVSETLDGILFDMTCKSL